MSKDIQFSFRCESVLRDQFVQACKQMDRPAGQVLREFMREFVCSHRSMGDLPIKDANVSNEGRA